MKGPAAEGAAGFASNEKGTAMNLVTASVHAARAAGRGSAANRAAAGRRAAFGSRTSPWSAFALALSFVWCVPAAAAEAGAAGPAMAAGQAAAARVIDLDLRDLPTVSEAKAATAAGVSRSESAAAVAGSESVGFRDPLVAEQQRASAKAAAELTVDVNVAGIGFTGATPASVVGEAGGGRFVQMVNAPGGSVFAVYDADDGDLLAGPIALDGLWQGAGACAEGWGHPNVVHDAPAGRWVLSEVGAGNHLCVYVSRTDDPVSGGWYAYDFALPRFPDFARLGVWADVYTVTTNEGVPAVYALQRSAMLGGAAAGWQRFTVPALDGFGLQALAPVDVDGGNLPPAGTGGLFVRHVDGQAHGGGDRLELFELDVDWASPGSSNLVGPTALATAPFDSSLCGLTTHECVPQPGTVVRLDPVREIVSWSARYRRFASHESLVGTFAVDVNGGDRAGIRWFELRRSGGAWGLHQEGTYSPDERHRWIGSAAVDRDGNLALVFNVSDGSSTFPSARVAGREAADPPGVLTASEVELAAGTSPQNAGHSPELWGASSSLSVDPGDDCTFWATAAYAEDGAWSTRIASYRFPSCAAVTTDSIFADGMESGDLRNWSDATP